MLIMPDDQTLIVAESYANRLTAFDIGPDGSLSNRRVWAELGDGVPDGICADAENAVWYADVPNKRCVRVREGGEVLQTIELDRGCFACALGGPDGATLFMIANEWSGPASMFQGRNTQVLTAGRRRPTPAGRSMPICTSDDGRQRWRSTGNTSESRSNGRVISTGRLSSDTTRTFTRTAIPRPVTCAGPRPRG